jgi:hypothetical protein
MRNSWKTLVLLAVLVLSAGCGKQKLVEDVDVSVYSNEGGHVYTELAAA